MSYETEMAIAKAIEKLARAIVIAFARTTDEGLKKL